MSDSRSLPLSTCLSGCLSVCLSVGLLSVRVCACVCVSVCPCVCASLSLPLSLSLSLSLSLAPSFFAAPLGCSRRVDETDYHAHVSGNCLQTVFAMFANDKTSKPWPSGVPEVGLCSHFGSRRLAAMSPKQKDGSKLVAVLQLFLKSSTLCTFDRHSEFDYRNLLENKGLVKALAEACRRPDQATSLGNLCRIKRSLRKHSMTHQPCLRHQKTLPDTTMFGIVRKYPTRSLCSSCEAPCSEHKNIQTQTDFLSLGMWTCLVRRCPHCSCPRPSSRTASARRPRPTASSSRTRRSCRNGGRRPTTW